MSEQALACARDARGVATVTIDRPAVHNAFDDQTIAALTALLGDLGADTSARVVVLRGAGRHFSAGADLNWMRRMADYDEAENVADARALAALLDTLARLPQPTVAVVQGAALGGGSGLVAACDMVIAAADARFAFSEVRLGLIPAVISPHALAAIGARAARRYFLTAEQFGADEALRMGLVHEVCPVEELDARAEKLIAMLAANPRQAMAEAKRLIADVTGRARDAALLDDLAARIAARRASPEGREGVGAFLDKRTPRWP